MKWHFWRSKCKINSRKSQNVAQVDFAPFSNLHVTVNHLFPSLASFVSEIAVQHQSVCPEARRVGAERDGVPLEQLLPHQTNRNSLTDSQRGKTALLTLSWKTFGPRRTSLYMPLVALYSGACVPTCVRVRARCSRRDGDYVVTAVKTSGACSPCLFSVFLSLKLLRTPEMRRHVVPCKVFFSPSP